MLIAIVSAEARARETVISEKSDDVNVTVYQDQNRGNRAINANWPRGYALISEKRTITIPAGESQIRFEGVSEGMLPESAVISGLPKGVIEKNRDERLLSPFGLIDAFLKRQVTVTRTNAVTGEVTTKDVLITAGPSGGVIFESDDGFEALRCTGLPERITYDEIPPDLSAKPTLSIITQADTESRVTLTLTYLAQGFDWQANYIANVDPDKPLSAVGESEMNLFAWLTVANGGNQSFDNANLMAIAGAPNRERFGSLLRPTGQALRLQCWPQGRTHEIPLWGLPSDEGFAQADSIVVTATRFKREGPPPAPLSAPVAAIQAEQENLGDLKLYRIPERVDVKAKGQKQVAMIVQPDAQYERIYKVQASKFADSSMPIPYILHSKNDKEKGLGLPLPSGKFAVFENSRFGRLLIGEGNIDDRAIGDKVELQMPASAQVQMTHVKIYEKKRQSQYEINISNALNHPINIEVELDLDTRNHKNIVRIDGKPTWVATIAANSEAQLSYKVKRPKP